MSSSDAAETPVQLLETVALDIGDAATGQLVCMGTMGTDPTALAGC